MDEKVTNEDEVDAGGTLEILDPTGHVEFRWGKDKDEVAAAEALFKKMLSEGYLAFKRRWFGRKGEQIKAFDPAAGAMLFDKSEPKPVSLPVNQKDPEAERRAAEEKARKEAEEAALQVRVDETKKAHAEASQKSRDARHEHERVTRLRREAREARSASEYGMPSLRRRLEEATQRREKADAALEEARRQAAAAPPPEPATLAPEVAPLPSPEATTTPADPAAPVASAEVAPAPAAEPSAAQTDVPSVGAPAPAYVVDVEAVAKERDAALAAETQARKEHDEAVEKLRVVGAALEELDAAEKKAYEAKREAEKLASSTEREYEEAMTALHGPPTNEQTREFDKKGKTTMTPPMKGG